jgi:hypothetical protein
LAPRFVFQTPRALNVQGIVPNRAFLDLPDSAKMENAHIRGSSRNREFQPDEWLKVSRDFISYGHHLFYSFDMCRVGEALRE